MNETEVSWRRILRFFLFIGPPAVIAAMVVSRFTDSLGGTSRILLYAAVFGGAQAVGTVLARSRWGALVFGPGVVATGRPRGGAGSDVRPGGGDDSDRAGP